MHLGDIAQLVEHLLCKQGVSGSNPLISTRFFFLCQCYNIMTRPFHIAIAVKDLESTREFYGQILGCQEGRSAPKWIDWNFFGHQLSTHVKPEEIAPAQKNEVDGKNVPVRHFGVILQWQQWQDLADNLKTKKIAFIIEPYIRFEGKIGEQATMFFLDYSGNALEFKAFKDDCMIFEK